MPNLVLDLVRSRRPSAARIGAKNTFTDPTFAGPPLRVLFTTQRTNLERQGVNLVLETSMQQHRGRPTFSHRVL